MKETRLVALAAGALVLAYLVCALAARPAVPTFDDAWYLETGFRLLAAMREGPAAFAHAWIDALKIKAPLACLLPLPLHAAFGPSESLAPWVNVPLLALTWLGARRVATRLFGEEAGWAALAAAALMPLPAGLARHHFVEPLVACLAVWTWVAIIEARRDDTRTGWRLGFLAGLGLLAKVTFPVLVALPLWLRRRELAPHLGRALAVSGTLALTWYAHNLPFVAGFAWQASFGPLAADYGRAGIPAALAWGLRLACDGVGPAVSLAALIALSVAARGRAFARPEFALALSLAAPLGLFALSANKELRLSAPLLPALAIAAAGAWSTLAPRLRGPLGLAAALGGAALFTPWAGARPYDGAGEASSWDRAALVAAIDATARPESVVAVALEHPSLNANNLASAAAARGRRWRAISLGYAQTNAESALIRLKDKDADHLVLVDGVPAAQLPAFLNRANDGIAAAVASGRLRARQSARVDLAPGISARVFVLIR